MKKFVALLMVVVMALAITACGGKSDEGGSEEPKEEVKIYAGSYSLEVPEGFEVDDNETQFTKKGEDGNDLQINIRLDKGTAEERVEYYFDLFKGEYKKADDVTFGDTTWKVLTYDFRGIPSAAYYTDLPDGGSAEINMMMMTADTPEGKQVMETIKFEENALEEYNNFFYK